MIQTEAVTVPGKLASTHASLSVCQIGGWVASGLWPAGACVLHGAHSRPNRCTGIWRSSMLTVRLILVMTMTPCRWLQPVRKWAGLGWRFNPGVQERPGTPPTHLELCVVTGCYDTVGGVGILREFPLGPDWKQMGTWTPRGSPCHSSMQALCAHRFLHLRPREPACCGRLTIRTIILTHFPLLDVQTSNKISHFSTQ